MILNNYHCSELECDYRTNRDTLEETDKQLLQDGGFDIDKQTKCPKCGKDTLVFVTTDFV